MSASNSHSLTWTKLIISFLSIFNIASAYRSVQHCKHAGDNGHYDACTAITQHYNTTSGESDLFVRYNWYKYSSSKNGWHAIGIGKAMPGALMFILYGNPSSGDLTVSVRTATGNTEPRPILEIDRFKTPKAEGRIPEVDIRNSYFESYSGSYSHPQNGKPSHVGIAEFIVRGHSKWIGTTVSNTSAAQPMIWSSNYKQDFGGDYSVERAIDMHEFGNGFGFMWVDFLNSETPLPIFGPIDETFGLKGANEVNNPAAPTSDELAKGDEIVASVNLDSGPSEISGAHKDDEHNPFNDHNTTPSTVPPDASEDTTEQDKQTETQTPSQGPERTIKGKTIRDWMWHLHGLLMTLAFLFIFPLGVYFIRSPRPTAFNFHWTIQSLGTLSLSLGCFIGWLNSRSISITHQYVGIFIVFLTALQLLSGWRHHVRYVEIKRRTWISYIHMNAGRIMLPLGFINIMTGLRLRRYGWFTQLLVLIVIVLETGILAIYLWRSNTRPRNTLAATSELKNVNAGTGADAEEYFQLAGEDEFSDSDGEIDANADEERQKKDQERREQNAKLAKLDRV